VFEELVENFSGKEFTANDIRVHYFPETNHIKTNEGNKINGASNIIQSNGQFHGKAIEISIQKNVFGMNEDTINTYKNTDIHDIRCEHNKLIECEGKNISIKSTGSTTVCCSKITRFLKTEDTIMIIASWKQINAKQKKCILNNLSNKMLYL